ncbi:probable multidrug resistance-associated protein lethal(2)03659 [Photinus pyralis]|uniref:probable multidrug resistance-associated protein lethal(2)03659 n=1 Tax=Photinus pyralis TaxID=7054 RepID=UPI0012673F11|nr:probable multidrug resistance-associated protein lethal(2)03659 [Photinus pyralis]
MDVSGNINRRPNPLEKAGILSKISFGYVWSTLREGLRKDFEEENLYGIGKQFDAAPLTDRLEQEWNIEKKKKKPTIYMPVLKIYGPIYLFYGLCYLAMSCSGSLLRPRLKGKFVSYFSPNQTELTETDAYYYGGGLVGFTALYTLLLHYYFFANEKIGLKIKVAIAGLIYRKSLKLKLTATSGKKTGDVITLITKDLLTLDEACHIANHFWVGGIQVIILTWIMYQELEVSALIGTGVFLLSLPIQMIIGRTIGKFRKRTGEKTDQRVRTTQEVITALRTIKMYTWESFFLRKIQDQRTKEIFDWRVLSILKTFSYGLASVVSKFSLYIAIMSYTAMGNNVTAEKAFVVTGCFGVLSPILVHFIPGAISTVLEAFGSVQRINKFLLMEEVQTAVIAKQVIGTTPKIMLKRAHVLGSDGNDIIKDITLEVNPGLTVLSGMVGSGKSTLMKLMLGDVFEAGGSVEITGTCSYSSQEPWLFPSTVKQNIIFNEAFDKQRYYDVIRVCELEKDIRVFPDGDQTRVIDKGLNLSRGQKMRINLARAIYKSADIYLLDDCLSSVDDHVANAIFQNLNKFLSGKIWILITFKEYFLSRATNIILLDGGRIAFQGGYKNLINSIDYVPSFMGNRNEITVNHQHDDVKELMAYEELEEGEESTLLPTLTKNIYAEFTNKGTVTKDVYFSYIRVAGGAKVFIFVIGFSIAAQAIYTSADYFVSDWVDVEHKMSMSRINQTTASEDYQNLESTRNTILTNYSFAIIGIFLMFITKSAAFIYFFSQAAKNIHRIILNSVVNACMKFFDVNLSGNIINRFSRDLGIIDEGLPMNIFEFVSILITLVSILFVISTVNPWFLIPSTILLIIMAVARWLYISTSRSMRRLEGATRSPLIGQLNATLEGLTTIRASKAEKVLKDEFDRHQNLYNSVVFVNVTISRALGFYLDFICCIYIAIVVLSFLIFRIDSIAGTVGLVITQAVYLTGILQWGVRQWANLENNMTSTERVLEYEKVEQEDQSGDNPKKWPTNGKITFTNVSLRYFPTSERVLKDISFEISSKFKIGVVGRTGAGKTSIISTLFRLYDFRGTITIDGVDINSLSMPLLRSQISIIPQDPVLFTGTIRSNLDPYNFYSDNDLWSALEEVDMKSSIPDLEYDIRDGGANFSIGQRQLICLARAIVRNNKILVLDEATANMDQKTDNLIQSTIKRRFQDCTVITIAHRINTVMEADRILVMDLGQILEFDNPQVLLNNKDGHFYKMAFAAGIKV